LFDTNTTGYCIRHLHKARGIPQIHGEELEKRREDDQWEKKHGERNTVACRICGILRARLGCRGSKHGKLNHLLDDHKLTVPEYRQHCRNRGWGNPPLESLKTREAAAQWWHDNTQKSKTYDLRMQAKTNCAAPLIRNSAGMTTTNTGRTFSANSRKPKRKLVLGAK
jgi:hypothetical protein